MHKLAKLSGFMGKQKGSEEEHENYVYLSALPYLYIICVNSGSGQQTIVCDIPHTPTVCH